MNHAIVEVDESLEVENFKPKICDFLALPCMGKDRFPYFHLVCES